MICRCPLHDRPSSPVGRYGRGRRLRSITHDAFTVVVYSIAFAAVLTAVLL